jgi:cysteine desulfurase / selenocysteine lyase
VPPTLEGSAAPSPLGGATTAYLDTACMGIPPRAAMDEVRALLQRVAAACEPPTDLVVELHRYYERARRAVASLIGATPAEIALVGSTSHGLGLVAAALPLQPGDNVLVSDLEFFPPVLSWRSRVLRGEVEVRAVPSREGRVEAEDFLARMDSRTRAVVFSSVQEINGFRLDAAALAAEAHAKGALVVVDGVQEAGCLGVDVRSLGVDVYCAGGHKWLCNPCGLGFLYLRADLAASLEPPACGYFAAREPAGGWDAYLSAPSRSPFDALEFGTEAARFEPGGYGNYPGAAALAVAGERLLQLGMDEVERRVLALSDRVRGGAEALGLEVRSAGELVHRSGITSIGLKGGPEQEKRAVGWLRDRNVFVSVRYTSGAGGIRVSPHHYTEEAEVDALLEGLATWQEAQSG